MPIVRFSGDGKWRGEWGVKRAGGVKGEGGGCWAGRKPRPGGEGGRWLGLGKGGGPREEKGEWASGRSHGPGGKEGGRAEIVAQAEIQGSKRKINLIDFWIKIRLEIE
jgi:hypothetical protein